MTDTEEAIFQELNLAVADITACLLLLRVNCPDYMLGRISSVMEKARRTVVKYREMKERQCELLLKGINGSFH